MIYRYHRNALEYDFRARFGFGLELVDRQELSWQQFISLITGLLNDHTSHTVASVEGWSYVPTAEEVFFYNELDVKAMMNRRRNQPAPQPVKRPWEQAKPSVRHLADPDHAQRLERLKQRLGLAPQLNS